MIGQPPLNPDALEAAARAMYAENPRPTGCFSPPFVAWHGLRDGEREVIREGTYTAVSAYLAAALPELATRAEQAEQAASTLEQDRNYWKASALDSEQAVARVREALSEVQTRGENIRAKGNNGSIYQQERAARGEGYLEATRLAFRALDGDPRAGV